MFFFGVVRGRPKVRVVPDDLLKGLEGCMCSWLQIALTRSRFRFSLMALFEDRRLAPPSSRVAARPDSWRRPPEDPPAPPAPMRRVARSAIVASAHAEGRKKEPDGDGGHGADGEAAMAAPMPGPSPTPPQEPTPAEMQKAAAEAKTRGQPIADADRGGAWLLVDSPVGSAKPRMGLAGPPSQSSMLTRVSGDTGG